MATLHMLLLAMGASSSSSTESSMREPLAPHPATEQPSAKRPAAWFQWCHRRNPQIKEGRFFGGVYENLPGQPYGLGAYIAKDIETVYTRKHEAVKGEDENGKHVNKYEEGRIRSEMPLSGEQWPMDPAGFKVQTKDHVTATSDAKVVVQIYPEYWKNGGLAALAANKNDPRVILENALNTQIMAKIKNMKAEDLIDGYALNQELNSPEFLELVNNNEQMKDIRLRVKSIFGDQETTCPVSLPKDFLKPYRENKNLQSRIGLETEKEDREREERIRKDNNASLIELNNKNLQLQKQLAERNAEAELHIKKIEKDIEKQQKTTEQIKDEKKQAQEREECEIDCQAAQEMAKVAADYKIKEDKLEREMTFKQKQHKQEMEAAKLEKIIAQINNDIKLMKAENEEKVAEHAGKAALHMLKESLEAKAFGTENLKAIRIAEAEAKKFPNLQQQMTQSFPQPTMLQYSLPTPNFNGEPSA